MQHPRPPSPVVSSDGGPRPQTGVGLVVPHDMALDRELWRWVPSDISLFFTRTPHAELEVTVEMITSISELDSITACTRDLVATQSAVYAYACASASYVRGRAGERELVEAMRIAGAPAAVTTAGALLAAITHLDARSVAVATPYEPDLARLLGEFLVESGVHMVASAHLGLVAGIAAVPYAVTADLVRRADSPEADAVVVSCTNLPTYDLIAPLEAELGKPVVTANQATIWAALDLIGCRAVGASQRLLTTGVNSG